MILSSPVFSVGNYVIWFDIFGRLAIKSICPDCRVCDKIRVSLELSFHLGIFRITIQFKNRSLEGLFAFLSKDHSSICDLLCHFNWGLTHM